MIWETPYSLEPYGSSLFQIDLTILTSSVVISVFASAVQMIFSSPIIIVFLTQKVKFGMKSPSFYQLLTRICHYSSPPLLEKDSKRQTESPSSIKTLKKIIIQRRSFDVSHRDDALKMIMHIGALLEIFDAKVFIYSIGII